MNLLFDLDGTLVDPFEGIRASIIEALNRLGLKAPSDSVIRSCIGPPMQKSAELLIGARHQVLAPEFVSEYRKHHSEIGIYKYHFFPEIDAVLPKLKEKHDLYVATSKPLFLAEKVLIHFDKFKYFKGVYGADLEGSLSDKSDLLAHLLGQEKLKSGDCIMIGDREHDIFAARKNNMESIGVLWGFGHREELANAKATHIVDSWVDLSNLCLSD